MTTRNRDASGVVPLAPSALVARELACQGDSLARMCDRLAVTPMYLAAVLDGRARDTALLESVAEQIGVAPAALRGLVA